MSREVDDGAAPPRRLPAHAQVPAPASSAAAASSRRLFRELTWLSSGYATRSLTYLGIVALLGRLLGPSSYGAVSLFIAVATGIGYLAGGWPFLSLPVLAARGASLGRAFRSALLAAFGGAVIAAGILLPLSSSLISTGPVILLIICAYALGLIVLQGLYAVFQTRGEMRQIAAAQTGERVLSLAILGVVGGIAGLTVERADIAIATAACLTAAAGLYTRRRVLRSRDGDPVTLERVIRSVGPMAVVGVSAYVIASIDIFILAAFRGHREVGIYAFAYQVTTFVMQLGSLWIVATLPHHSRAAVAGADEAALLAPQELGPLLSLWSAGVAATAAAAAVAVPLVVGRSFTPSLGPLMILLAGIAPLGAYFAAASVAIALDRARMLAVIGVVGALINVTLDVLLIPVIGIWGPAVATLALNLFSVVAALWALAGRRAAGRILLGTVIPAAGILLLASGPRNPILLAVVGTVAAAAAVRALRLKGREITS